MKWDKKKEEGRRKREEIRSKKEEDLCSQLGSIQIV